MTEVVVTFVDGKSLNLSDSDYAHLSDCGLFHVTAYNSRTRRIEHRKVSESGVVAYAEVFENGVLKNYISGGNQVRRPATPH